MTDYIRKLMEQDREIRRLLNPLDIAAAGFNPHDRLLARASADLDLFSLLSERAELDAQAAGFLSADQYRTVAFGLAQRSETEIFVEDMIRREAATGIAGSYIDLISEASRTHNLWEASFRLPEVSEIETLLGREMGAAPDWASQFTEHTIKADLIAAAGAMREPWLNETALQRSFSGFAEMQVLGAALQSAPPFAADVVKVLRHSFGDWRDTEIPDIGLLQDPVTRTALYYSHGFSPDITAFPRPAFKEALRQAGLDLEGDESVEHSVEGNPADETEGEVSEAAFTRNRAAFDQLQRFEVAMRRFLDRVLSDAYGANWIPTCVPQEMSDHWRMKQEAELKVTGTAKPLIEYADFADYRVIIERKANWNGAFKPVFKRQSDIQESFQRLYPVRIATMHARMITQDDEMLLLVETRRILKAIKSNE